VRPDVKCKRDDLVKFLTDFVKRFLVKKGCDGDGVSFFPCFLEIVFSSNSARNPKP